MNSPLLLPGWQPAILPTAGRRARPGRVLRSQIPAAYSSCQGTLGAPAMARQNSDELCSHPQCGQQALCLHHTRRNVKACADAKGTGAGSGVKTREPPASSSAKQPTNLMTTKDKLELVQQLERRSTAAMKDVDMHAGIAPPRLIDARMYTAAVANQRKISEKLSDANLYIDVLQDQMEGYDDDLEAAADIFKKVSMEFGTTGRLADAAVAAVKFGVDPQDAVVKITKLKERLEALEKAMKKERELFARRVPRKVPVTWVGAASEVKLVGDFDKWSRGIDLGNPDVESDSVMRTFQATVSLLPGKYRVKFLVDNEWRLAPEWPMENDEKGETNNVLEVK